MEHRYLKDFVISLVVILIIAYAIKEYYLFYKIDKIPIESVYKKVALKKSLLKKINQIDKSIKDRKNFVFTVTKDPLEQHLIVKTRKDLEKQWEQEVKNMYRLEYTMISEDGTKMAAVAHKGKTKIYKIGDNFLNGKVLDIQNGKMVYSYYDTKKVMKVSKIPPKPEELLDTKHRKNNEINW